MDLSLKNSIPWLVLAGSGGVADFLSDMLENLSSATAVSSATEGDSEAAPSVDLKDRVAERVRKYFPTEADTDKLVERVRRTITNSAWALLLKKKKQEVLQFSKKLA